MNNPLNSLDTWVAYAFLTERGMTAEEVAYELHLNERRLREFIRDHTADMTRRIHAEPDKVAQVRRELERRYPVAERQEDDLPNIDHKKVVKLLGELQTLDRVSARLKVDHAVFIRWYNKNLPIINRQLGQAG